MKPSGIDAPITLKRVQQMLGLSRTVVAGLIEQGFVSPARGPKNELRFSFQDLTLLRIAHGLQKARVAPRKILRALAKLKAELPPQRPLTGLRITALGTDVVVRSREQQWHAETGQLLLDFEITPPPGGDVTLLQRSAPAASSATDLYEEALALEGDQPAAAEQAYRRAIDLDPGHVGATLNLGAMLCESDRCQEAVALYERAVAYHPDDARLHFNHAIALEDARPAGEAIAAYLRALAADASMADAHYNAARLYERAGDTRSALRHFSAYRRLDKTPPR